MNVGERRKEVSLLNNYLGTFKLYKTCQVHIGEFSVWRTYVTINDNESFPLRNSFLNCVGCSEQQDLALLKAKAEAIERYTMSLVSQVSKFKSNPLGYDEISSQIDSMRFVHKTSLDDIKGCIAWVEAKDVITKSTFDIPEQLVNFKVNNKKFPYQVTPVSSNGFSAHTDVKQAYLKGMLECIERDTVLRAWLTWNGLSKIPKRLVPSKIKYLFNYLKEENWILSLNIIENAFNIPTVWLIGYNPSLKTGKVLFGAKSSLNIQEAINGACMEFLSNYGLVGVHFELEKVSQNHIKIFLDYLSSLPQNEQIYESAKIKNYEGLALRLYERRKLRCFISEFELPEVKAEGFHVIRAIIPGLMYFWDKPTKEVLHVYSENSIRKRILGDFTPVSIYK